MNQRRSETKTILSVSESSQKNSPKARRNAQMNIETHLQQLLKQNNTQLQLPNHDESLWYSKLNKVKAVFPIIPSLSVGAEKTGFIVTDFIDFLYFIDFIDVIDFKWLCNLKSGTIGPRSQISDFKAV